MANPEEEINRLNKALQDTLRLLADLKSASVANRGGVISDADVKALERYNALLAEERARLSGATKTTTSKELDDELTAARNRFKIGAPPQGATHTVTNGATIENEIKLTEKQIAAKKRLEEEEKRLSDLRKRIATDPVYRQYMEQLQARGLNENDIQGALNRGGDITQVTAARNMGGVNNKFQGYVNEKTGTSTPALSSQFRSFGSDILRDIGQFTKWSIAIAAVYTPMQKLGELMTIMVDNESRLADATIAANVPFSKSGEIFDQVAISANKAGESINTTIDAYTQAIRAAGRYGSEQEKSAQATALLNDSLILSKLSALDQSTAIDTLSAALLQSDRELNQGQELLNKWVRVSQVANVGIDALATGVAVLGDAAETSGLSIDQLNGLIAVLSEQSISGSKEAANTAKALVGAYQSDKAEAALNKYGVALRRANGEVRGFLEIYQELSSLRQKGVLSEAAVSEVALALGGGGVRRAKDASALINSTDRLNKLAAESAAVTGDDTVANDALAKKLETVQTANTRLANSFQELAQTLGNQGGLLDGIKTLVNLLTDAVKVSTELFAIMGRSGPILATVVAGLGAMNAYYGVGGRKDVALARLGATGGGFKGFGFGLGGGATGAQYGATSGGGPLADILRMNYKGAGIIAGAGVALQAGSNIAAGKNENAAGNILGGVIGGAIGTALGGPIGLAAGANIGSAIGDAFINGIEQHSEQLADYFTPKRSKAQAEADQKAANAAPPKEGETTTDLLNRAYDSLTFGQKLLASARANPQNINAAGTPVYQNKESAAMDILKSTNRPLYDELYKRFQDLQKKQAQDAVAAAAQQVPQETQAITTKRKELETQASLARREQLNRLAGGEITTAEFGRVTNQISGFPATSIKSVTAFGDEITKVSKDIQNTTEAYDAFLYIATNGTQEQINLISGYSDDILTLKGYLENWKPELKGMTLKLNFGDYEITSEEDMRKLIADLQKQGSTSLGITLAQVQKQQAQKVYLPPLVGDYNKPTPQNDYNNAVEKGKEIQLQFYQSVGKTDAEIQSLIAGIETFYTTVDTGSQTIFKATSGLEQRFYDLAKAAEEAAGAFGLQQFDVDRATLERLAAQSLQLGQTWEMQTKNDNLPGYFETKPEDTLAITKEGIAKPIHADMRILAILLQELNDKTQKQLDGQYNIPEGATFWVPLTAAYYRNKEGGSGSDLQSMLDSLAVDTNTSATNNNTRALEQLSSSMTNTDRLKLEYQDTKLKPGESKPLAGFQNEQRLKAEYQIGEQVPHTPGGLANPMPRNETTQSAANNQLLQSLQTLNSTLMQMQGGVGIPNLKTPTDTSKMKDTGTVISPTTKLDLKFSSNINLLVDGRILAQTLQSYMASELLRTEQTQGVITKRYTL